MPLNYLDLQNKITLMADAAAARKTQLENRLEKCESLLHEQANHSPAELQKLVESAAVREKNLRCAVPSLEALDAHFPQPSGPVNCAVLAADGSQITPSAHEALFYGVVNVGTFFMLPGSGQVPSTYTSTELIFEEEDAEENELITEDLVNLRRDVLERETLAALAKNLPAPLITLTDGPLELYHEPRENKQFKRYFHQYLDSLSELALFNTITAGYIDRPRAALLVNLLNLTLGEDEPFNAFAGLSDLALMKKLLQPGERSAVFALQSRSSKEFEGRKALHFFYLNVGSTSKAIIARVEVPLWVVESPDSLNLLHSVLLTQSRLSGQHPYPYALLRAHETAVVRMDEHDSLNRMIQNEYLKRGLPITEVSEKLANKQVGQRTRMK